MLLLLRFYVFLRFLKIQKKLDFDVFMLCFTRFLELRLPEEQQEICELCVAWEALTCWELRSPH